MLDDLVNNLEDIHDEVMTKLIPENIKKDVEILGVTGTYEGSGTSPMTQAEYVTASGYHDTSNN